MPEKSFLAHNGANLRKVIFGMFSVYYICSLTGCCSSQIRVRLIDSYADDAMAGQLLPSRLRKHVAASIQHIALSFLHGEKAKVL